MHYKALVNFSGLISMYKEEIKDLKNVEKYIIEDLVKCGYIEEVKTKTIKK